MSTHLMRTVFRLPPHLLSSFGCSENTATYWSEDVRRGAPNTPILLIGTMSDLRNDPLLAKEGKTTFTVEEGEAMAKYTPFKRLFLSTNFFLVALVLLPM